jgi:hypothetical protein
MKFLPGQSGNPAGRPPGALNKKTLALQAAFDAKAEDAVNDIMERSKAGQPAAMRLCMERAVPAGRHRLLAFRLPPIATPEDAELAIEVVMHGLAQGMLTLAEVSTMLNLVERLLGLAEVIAQKKHTRAVIQSLRNPTPVPDETEEAPAERALDTGDERELDTEDEPEEDEDDDLSLYFPVNPADTEPAEAVGARAGPPPAGDRVAAAAPAAA